MGTTRASVYLEQEGIQSVFEHAIERGAKYSQTGGMGMGMGMGMGLAG